MVIRHFANERHIVRDQKHGRMIRHGAGGLIHHAVLMIIHANESLADGVDHMAIGGCDEIHLHRIDESHRIVDGPAIPTA